MSAMKDHLISTIGRLATEAADYSPTGPTDEAVWEFTDRIADIYARRGPDAINRIARMYGVAGL